ncbi:MAG: hypothetical protein KKH21_18975, partial [Gammaproteobacteria bacterium]|nr:hypothetical protein [Gammaproteobacteria bacterium]
LLLQPQRYRVALFFFDLLVCILAHGCLNSERCCTSDLRPPWLIDSFLSESLLIQALPAPLLIAFA